MISFSKICYLKLKVVSFHVEFIFPYFCIILWLHAVKPVIGNAASVRALRRHLEIISYFLDVDQ